MVEGCVYNPTLCLLPVQVVFCDAGGSVQSLTLLVFYSTGVPCCRSQWVWQSLQLMGTLTTKFPLLIGCKVMTLLSAVCHP